MSRHALDLRPLQSITRSVFGPGCDFWETIGVGQGSAVMPAFHRRAISASNIRAGSAKAYGWTQQSERWTVYEQGRLWWSN